MVEMNRTLLALKEAKRLMEYDKIERPSKELSVSLTELETAILWLREDLKNKEIKDANQQEV